MNLLLQNPTCRAWLSVGLVFILCLHAEAVGTWKSEDIGQVSPAGSSHVDDQTKILTIKGGGWDIEGTTDAFQYVYQTASGNAELIAHLRSLDDTADWAKVGLMVRQSSDEGSTFAMMTQSPERGLGFLYRLKPNGGCGVDQFNNNGAPVWLRVVKDGNVVSGYDSPDGVKWTCRGAVRLPLSGPVEIGMAVCSRTTAALCTAAFDHVTLNSESSFAPSKGWVEKDVGETPIPGGVHCEGDECNLFASGSDIWDASDSFHFLSRPLQGDGAIIVCIKDILNTDAYAKAGIMFREDDTPDSRQVSLLMMPGQGPSFLRRKVKGGWGLHLDFSGVTPLWLKLTRGGDIFTASISTDGTDWRFMGKDAVPMNRKIEYGLVLSPKRTDKLGMAAFDHLSAQSALP